MKKNIRRIAAGIALTAIVATSFPTVSVNAATSSIFPSAGASLAAGIGTSIYDIRANVARAAAHKNAYATHNAIVNGESSPQVSKASVVAPGKDEDAGSATASVAAAQVPQPVGGNIAKVETPSSKVVTEGSVIDGVSVVGSASLGAQIEVTESDSSVVAAASTGAAPQIEVAPDVEIAEGEEDLSRSVIAICDGYVNVRAEANENAEIVGKLYNHSAGTWLGKEGDWYKIESGNVVGYVMGDYVATGQEAVRIAAEVGIRTAVVHTTTLKIREEASTESKVLGMVANEDQLTVVEETEEWIKVQIEEGDGWVSKEYVEIYTDFPKAESKAEEEARLKQEEEARRKANAAAQKATKKNNTSTSSAGVPAPAVSAGGSGLGSQVANYGLQFVGNPYVYGGTSLTNGTDCSGFTMGVYKAFGVSLPHSSGAQRSVGYGVGSLAEAQPGDIICYSGHVAIYIGNGQIVHASTAATGIKVSNVSYRSILAIRRIF